MKSSVELDPSPGDGDQGRDDVIVTAVGADGVTRNELDVGALIFEDADSSSPGGLIDALGQSFEAVYADPAIGFDLVCTSRSSLHPKRVLPRLRRSSRR